MVWRGRFARRVRDGMLGAWGWRRWVSPLSLPYTAAGPIDPPQDDSGAGGGHKAPNRPGPQSTGSPTRRRDRVAADGGPGSETALEAVTSRQVDVALVQGGLDLADLRETGPGRGAGTSNHCIYW